MKVELERLVELRVISEEFCDELKTKYNIHHMSVAKEALQDAIFRGALMSAPLTGPLTQEEVDDWNILFEYFTNEHIEEVRKQVKPEFDSEPLFYISEGDITWPDSFGPLFA